MPWNVDDAVKYLDDNARKSSAGRCAEYVRKAIEAGGVTLARHTSAKDYGTSLTDVGFLELSYCPLLFQKGDVVVVAAEKGHPHGHIAMYDGAAWVSDYVQKDGFYPAAAYRAANTAYAIYRHPLANPKSILLQQMVGR